MTDITWNVQRTCPQHVFNSKQPQGSVVWKSRWKRYGHFLS